MHNDNTFGDVISTVDSCGRFEAKLPCVCLSELSVECVAADVYWIYVLCTGNEIMLTRDAASGCTLVMGRICPSLQRGWAYRRYVEAKEDYVELDYFDTISHEAYLDRVRSEVEEGLPPPHGGAMPPWRGCCRVVSWETNRATTLLAMINYASYRRFALRSGGRTVCPNAYSFIPRQRLCRPAAASSACCGAIRPYISTSVPGGSRRSKIYSPVIETLLYMDEHGIRMLSER